MENMLIAASDENLYFFLSSQWWLEVFLVTSPFRIPIDQIKMIMITFPPQRYTVIVLLKTLLSTWNSDSLSWYHILFSQFVLIDNSLILAL